MNDKAFVKIPYIIGKITDAMKMGTVNGRAMPSDYPDLGEKTGIPYKTLYSAINTSVNGVTEDQERALGKAFGFNPLEPAWKTGANVEFITWLRDNAFRGESWKRFITENADQPSTMKIVAEKTEPANSDFADFDIWCDGSQLTMPVGDILKFYHEVYCEPHDHGKGLSTGLKFFDVVFTLPNRGDVKMYLPSEKSARNGVVIESRGTRSHPRIRVHGGGPPIRIRVVDKEKILACLKGVIIGDVILVEMKTRIDNGFATERDINIASANRRQVFNLLGKRLRFGELGQEAEYVTLSRQRICVEAAT